MTNSSDHVSVCICTYKRPRLLQRLIDCLLAQTTDASFTFSVVIVDNDKEQSARDIVCSYIGKTQVMIDYHCEPEQNIALARNRAVENASGNFIAFLDDDEFPVPAWLQTLIYACRQYQADGVLGPVKPSFDVQPPEWVLKGKMCERRSFVTGTVLKNSRDTRTGNVLFTAESFADARFDPRFGKTGGEDVDLFNRLMRKGKKFVWCDEAIAYETVPQERLTRSYFLRRALLRGAVSSRKGRLHYSDVVKSAIAVPLYTATLPFLLLIGHHFFMQYLAKDCVHLGRLLGLLHLEPVQEKNF